MTADATRNRWRTRRTRATARLVGGLLFLHIGGPATTETQASDAAAFVSVADVLALCGVPRLCGAPMACEGKIVRVSGAIDYDNVFDREHYPQLPYEKFTLRGRSGHTLEVWMDPTQSRDVFRQIHREQSAPEKMAHVEGEIVGVDMPILGTCQRGIKINLISAKTFFLK